MILGPLEHNQGIETGSPSLDLSAAEMFSKGRTQLGQELRGGETCPFCRKGKLDYDGQLNLSCSECGYAVGGGFT